MQKLKLIGACKQMVLKNKNTPQIFHFKEMIAFDSYKFHLAVVFKIICFSNMCGCF